MSQKIKKILTLLIIIIPTQLTAGNNSNDVDLSFFDEPAKKSTDIAKYNEHSPQHDFLKAVHAYKTGDHIRAFKLFHTLAAYGNANAQYNLASMYYNGYGILKNRQKAAFWYRHSALRGHVISQHSLAALYYKGLGVTRSYSHAYQWFSRAANQGHADSQYNLAIMYYSAQGVAHNPKEAFKWFMRAAKQGDINSQYNLGTMYYTGIGVDRNMVQAFRWHTRAARNGHPQSRLWLKIQLRTAATK